jgi:hypothetical protein
MKSFTALTHGALLTLALGLTFGSGAQELRVTSRQYAQVTTAPDTPKSYFPGLGEFMARIQTNHAKLWLAGEAHNWDLAEYQLGEMKEVFSDVQDFIPRYKDIPVGDMIDAIMTGIMSDLERAIGTRDLAKFSGAFDILTQSCNSCHAAAGRGYIVLQRPPRSNFSNQNFAPAE